jgi:hypothetical protein
MRKKDHAENLRRFQLAHLLKGSLLNPEDLMPRPSSSQPQRIRRRVKSRPGVRRHQGSDK